MTGTWQGLTNQPPFQTSTMILLTDGRVMVQQEATAHWHALTPDPSGSYVDGTWSPLADMSFWRRYYASAVLRDGRVIVVGGEQSGDVGDTPRGEIYDPVADAWTQIPSPPGWSQVGDAASCLLPDGRLMIGALLTPDCVIYDPATDSWSAAASKAVRSNEETWVLLPDESVLTVQCFAPFESERYSSSSNSWKNEGKLPVRLVDSVMHEIGPAMLTYDGKVIYFGAANFRGYGRTAIYTPPANPNGTGSWAPGPVLPQVKDQTIVCNDCPASLMPNGKVLVTGAPYEFNNWGSPIYFFEYDPFTATIIQAPTAPNNNAQLFWSRLMLLPTGQVLFGPSAFEMQVYLPDGGPQEAWRPTVREVVRHCGAGGDYYIVRGEQLNGLSQANMYGDDCYSATNYPLVRLRSTSTGEVFYCRTYGMSTMAVATGASPQSVRFDPATLPYGEYELCVVANGISSHSVGLCHRRRHAGYGRTPSGCVPDACPCDDQCCAQPDCDPQISRLQAEVSALRSNLGRYGAIAPTEQPARAAKETREVSAAERREADNETAGGAAK